MRPVLADAVASASLYDGQRQQAALALHVAPEHHRAAEGAFLGAAAAPQAGAVSSVGWMFIR